MRKPFFLLGIILSVIATSTYCPSTATSSKGPANLHAFAESQSPSALKVLFIGNSILYVGEIPEAFAALVQSANSQSQLKVSEVGGSDYTLRDHIEDGTAERTINSGGPWDCVVLQEHSSEVCNKTAECTEAAKVLAADARKVRAKVYVFDCWLKNTPDEYLASSTACAQMASALGAERIPVALALFQAQRALPRLQLYEDDHHHLAPAGVYLAACVLYAKLVKRSPQGLPTKLYEGEKVILDLPSETCRQLQYLANNAISGK
jgi:hypothetical protein